MSRHSPLLLVLGVLGLSAGCSESTPPPLPDLQGTWFVRYASDPRAYLDVALSDKARPALVTAELSGPTGRHPDLALAFNPKDGEWQAICDFLPAELAPGLWWVSRVRMTMSDGRTREYLATDPREQYRRDDGRPSQAWLGAFSASGSGQPRHAIETWPAPGGRALDNVLRVYRAADTRRWFAMGDDPDVDQPYASLTLQLQPGQTYYAEVSSTGDLGDYAIRVAPEGLARPAPTPGTGPDRSEPNDDPAHATPLEIGQVRAQTLDRPGDRDWFVFATPSAQPRAPE